MLCNLKTGYVSLNLTLYILKGGREREREGERERKGERERERERERDTHTRTRTHTHTHTTERTLEKRDKAAEDKTVGGIFSRAWYIGLAEPGKRTVKHNNKRNTTVKRESHSTLSESCVERVNKKMHFYCNIKQRRKLRLSRVLVIIWKQCTV